MDYRTVQLLLIGVSSNYPTYSSPASYEIACSIFSLLRLATLTATLAQLLRPHPRQSASRSFEALPT